MQKFIDIIKKAALAVFAAVIATSCVMEKEQMPDPLQSVMIQLNVSAGQMTKAVTEAPADIEKRINSIRIFAFEGSRLAGHFFRAGTSSEPIFMDLLLPTTGTSTLDFYVIANEAAMRLTSSSAKISSSMTKEQLSALSFDAIHSIATYGLPMSAKIIGKTIDVESVSAQLNTMTGHEEHQILEDKVEVNLSRPLAKISLYVAKKEASSSLIISEVSMLPGGTRQYGYLYKPTDLSLIESIPARANGRTLFTGILEVEKYLSSEADKEDASKYEEVFADAYLPEVPFDGGDTKSVILNIASSGGYGSKVNNGLINMPKIERDVHYKVYCSFAANGKVTIDFIVADWQDATMWPGGLIFDHPTHSFLLPDASSTLHSSDPAQMKYVAGEDSGAFVGYFQMIYPAGQRWTPTIFDGIAGDCRVEVWKGDGSREITNPAEWVSGDTWYMIKVIPEVAENVGEKLKLAITYLPVWSDQAEFLMINGNQSDIVWPYISAGETDTFKADPNYVVITQK